MFGRICAIVYSVAAMSAAYADGLESELEVYAVEGETLSTSQVDEAKPGQTLEYQLIYKNASEGEFKNLVINGLIPKNTKYIADSADSKVKHELWVSYDGGRHYHQEPVYREVKNAEGDIVKKEKVNPSEYTHVRWKSLEPIKEEQVQIYTYRVIVQ